MNGQEVDMFMDSITKLIDTKISEKLSNALLVKPAKVISVSQNGLKADIEILGESSVLSDVEVYSNRTISPNDNCHIVYWGSDGKRISNVAILFGGN